MQTSIYFEITINDFNQKPILIKSSLQGFESALKELNNSKS
jgi:invasion protein IalB